jgi:site-specific recombinase XerD
VADLDRKAVLAFLNGLEKERGNSITTRNHRLAVARSFFRFLSANMPEAVEQCTQILAIPLKRGDSRSVDYLTVDEVQFLLKQISLCTPNGKRDDALLRLLYNTGARVQEVLDIRIRDLKLSTPAHVLLHGKGKKDRLCPLWSDTVERLQTYIRDRHRGTPDSPLFANRKGDQLTRSGIRYILSRYVDAAIPQCPNLKRKRVHPHTVRHSTAMHLLQSGVDLNTIRCWLGHANIATTNRYVELDLEMKRRALDTLEPPPGNAQTGAPGAELLTWLEGL